MKLERTHWEGCWRERTHHECALARIADLEEALAAERERLEAKKLEVDAARTGENPIVGGPTGSATRDRRPTLQE